MSKNSLKNKVNDNNITNVVLGTKTKFSAAILDQLNAKEIKSSIANKNSGLYKMEKDTMNRKDKMSFRRNRRNEREKLQDCIQLAAKKLSFENSKDNAEKLQSAISDFQKWAEIWLISPDTKDIRTFYRGNDSHELKNVQLTLDIINQFNS